MVRTLPYAAGDVCAVPLRDQGYVLGLVARMDGKGIVLGYFFGPRIDSLEGLPGQFSLDKQAAVKISRFGDLGLIQKKWPVVGRAEAWNPEEWPMPKFCRNGEILVTHSNDTLEVVREERLRSAGCNRLPQDGLEGSGFVEIKLTRLLAAS